MEYVWRMWRTSYTPSGLLRGHSGFWYVISEIPVYLCVACCPCTLFQLEQAGHTVRRESGITSTGVQAQEDELEHPPSDSSNIRRTKLQRASPTAEKLTTTRKFRRRFRLARQICPQNGFSFISSNFDSALTGNDNVVGDRSTLTRNCSNILVRESFLSRMNVNRQATIGLTERKIQIIKGKNKMKQSRVRECEGFITPSGRPSGKRVACYT